MAARILLHHVVARPLDEKVQVSRSAAGAHLRIRALPRFLKPFRFVAMNPMVL
jgi:hypothetical protein